LHSRSNTPQKIGRYDVAGLLATGGMAELFLASQSGPSGFERPVVIKRILPHLAREQSFRDMFLDEARLVVNIRHPNVVQVHELGDDRGEIFLVMEYLEGESLSMVSQVGETLPPRAVAHILAEACAGLHAAHELTNAGRSLGLVHRDVSPHNLFILYSGQAKVIDFGIAKSGDRTSKTQTGTVKGKFAYMAPEQVKAEDVDRRADVFALGVILHELLTGKPLFARANDLLVMQAVCLEPVPPPSAFCAEVDPELERIAMKALSRSREERYPTAQAMRRELVTALQRLSAESESPELADEELASVMRAHFADRVARKAEMLARVREGRTLTRIVGGETDIVLSAEAASQASGTGSPGQVLSLRPAAPSRKLPVALSAAVVMSIGIAVGIYASREEAPGSLGAPASAPAESAPAPRATTPGSPQPVKSVEPVVPSSSIASAASSVSTASPSTTSIARPLPRPVATPPTPVSKPTSGFGRFD
jgi:serine/threonine-protein kinase